MEIIIDGSKELLEEHLDVDSFSQLYWKSLSPHIRRIKYKTLTRETLENAQNVGLKYLEILVENILIPGRVKFKDEFNKRRVNPPDLIDVNNSVLDEPAFKSIVQSVNQHGEGTTFRFRYPIARMLEFLERSNRGWIYTLGKEGENVFLLLYPLRSNLRKPTVSKGVKIPSGR